MRSRVLGIKKSVILRIATIICLVLCVFFIFFSIFHIKNYDLWFFVFCFFMGVIMDVKSVLFRTDSACYLGLLLTMVGISGFLCYYFNVDYKYFYILSAVALASIFTFFFTKQKFQFFTGVLFAASGGIAFLYSNKIINLAIFLAIYLSFLFIFFFVCAILLIRYFKKSKEG